MLSLLIKPPADILLDLGQRAKEARLAQNLTRKTLSERSGIPESTIKRFEATGQIGTAALVDLAVALDMLTGIDRLFEPKPIQSTRDIVSRRRGSV